MMKAETVTYAPKARAEGLLVRELSDEVLVYDLESHRAMCLNRTAALVWKLCDGRLTIEAIACAVAGELKQTVSVEVVWLALDQLGRGGLLRERVKRPAEFAGMSRREVVRKIGLAAAGALPVVASIVAPTAAQAASCRPSGASCTDSAQCCSGVCGESFTCVG
jgi:hypothetical protein